MSRLKLVEHVHDGLLVVGQVVDLEILELLVDEGFGVERLLDQRFYEPYLVVGQQALLLSDLLQGFDQLIVDVVLLLLFFHLGGLNLMKLLLQTRL